ncbi:hypothetical protein N9M21_06825 [Alphaproteobacteria bacterium]|nr:hypothetical protein [Alphaproteobacteria bacterium]
MRFLKRGLATLFLVCLTSVGAASADDFHLGDYPTKISIVVDTSNSMLGVDGATLRQKSVLVRNELVRNVTDKINISGMDLWQFGGRDTRRCENQLVYSAEKGDVGIIEAVNSLKQLQAGNMLAVNDAKNPIYDTLVAASNEEETEGVLLITDSAEDCNLSPKAVCEAAGNIGIPVFVLSLAATTQGRMDLECLANVSHGAFAHATSGAEVAPLMQTLMSVAISRAQISVAEMLLLSLNDKNTELSNENRRLWAKNAELEYENGELVQQIKDLLVMLERREKTIAERDVTIAEQKQTIGELHSAVEGLSAENALLKAEIAKLNQLVADQQVLIAEMSDTIEYLEGVITEKDGAIAALHVSVKDLTDKNAALREEVARLTSNLEAANEEIGILNEHIVRLITERDALKISLGEKVQEIADLRVSLEACQTEKQALNETLDRMTIKITELEQTVITATSNCEARVLGVRTSERAQCTTQVNLIETGCQKQQDALRDHIAELEQTIEAKNGAIGGLHEEIKALQAEIADRESMIRQLIEIEQGLKAENAFLLEQIDDLNKTVRGMQRSIADLSLALESCEEGLRVCKREYSEIEMKFDIQSAENAALVRDIQELRSLLSTCEGSLGQAIMEQERLRYVEAKNVELRQEITMTRAKLSACEADKNAFKNGLNPLVDNHLESPSDVSE